MLFSPLSLGPLAGACLLTFRLATDGDVAALVCKARRLRRSRPAAATGVRRAVVLEQAIWQPLLVRRLTFAVDGACVHGEQQSPAGALLFYNA